MLMSGVLKHPDKGQTAANNVQPDNIFSPILRALKFIELDGEF
jgi:hypothetical protein